MIKQNRVLLLCSDSGSQSGSCGYRDVSPSRLQTLPTLVLHLLVYMQHQSRSFRRELLSCLSQCAGGLVLFMSAWVDHDRFGENGLLDQKIWVSPKLMPKTDLKSSTSPLVYSVRDCWPCIEICPLSTFLQVVLSSQVCNQEM